MRIALAIADAAEVSERRAIGTFARPERGLSSGMTPGVITTLGLIAIVGSAVLVGAAVVIKHHDRARAGAIVVGAALVWISVRIVKSVVDRPRPPDPLVHTSGQSYPSAHAANSVGWLALAIALTVVIPTRAKRSRGFVISRLTRISDWSPLTYQERDDTRAGSPFALCRRPRRGSARAGNMAWTRSLTSRFFCPSHRRSCPPDYSCSMGCRWCDPSVPTGASITQRCRPARASRARDPVLPRLARTVRRALVRRRSPTPARRRPRGLRNA